MRGNYIGLDTTGTKPLGNDYGVVLQGGTGTVVGGALGIDSRNLIARNALAGIRINGATKSTIIGNYITDNQGPGVLADAKGGDAVIGLAATSIDRWDDVNCRDTRCNRIENNRGAGVRMTTPSEITVRGNRMRANTGPDVDNGAARNDARATTGPTPRPRCRSSSRASSPARSTGSGPP